MKTNKQAQDILTKILEKTGIETEVTVTYPLCSIKVKGSREAITIQKICIASGFSDIEVSKNPSTSGEFFVNAWI